VVWPSRQPTLPRTANVIAVSCVRNALAVGPAALVRNASFAAHGMERDRNLLAKP